MRVIFLDIDGVCNSADYFCVHNPMDFTEHIDPAEVLLLNGIVARTGAKVVISSSWRFLFNPTEMQKILTDLGFSGEVVGQTTHEDRGLQFRGEEIKLWLDEHRDVESFVILDDETDMEPVADHLVHTDRVHGLSLADADRAIELLLTE